MDDKIKGNREERKKERKGNFLPEGENKERKASKISNDVLVLLLFFNITFSVVID